MNEEHEALLTAIAREHLRISTLETRHGDDLDFHDVAVWGVRNALHAAFTAGRKWERKKDDRDSQNAAFRAIWMAHELNARVDSIDGAEYRRTFPVWVAAGRPDPEEWLTKQGQ